MSDDDGLKRLRMRAWRRGIKEMDLILGPFADEALTELDAVQRVQFEALLAENDHDLYQWLTARIGRSAGQSGLGQSGLGPAAYGALLDRIAVHAAERMAGGRS